VLPNTPQTLAAWISDPQRHKPGSNMPPAALPPDDLQALVAYLGTLQ
jgi:cytochrome c oxidase subunit 2